MAKKLIELEEAAKMIGISPDALNEMRNRHEISAYRDGASWKFKPEDIERIITDRRDNPDQSGVEYQEDELDSILLSEVELGESAPSTSSTVIGKSYEPPSPESDIQLAAPRAAGADASDVRLATDSEIASTRGSSLSAKFDDLDSLDLDLPTAEESGISLGSSALTVSATDDLNLGDSNVTLGGEINTAEPPELSGGSAIDLASPEDDDDLVLGGSSGLGSDVTHAAGDSGISLVDPSDSGLSLEDPPLQLVGSSLEQLNLGGGDDMVLLEEEDASESPTQLKSDDDFLLTPMGDADEEESGSQVIALEGEPDFDDAASTMLGGRSAASGGVMLEESLDDAFEAAPLGAGAPAPAAGLAATTAIAMPTQAIETPYSVWNVLSLMLCILLLTFSGMMMYDLLRNMWSWNAPYAVNSSIMDAIVGMFGG